VKSGRTTRAAPIIGDGIAGSGFDSRQEQGVTLLDTTFRPAPSSHLFSGCRRFFLSNLQDLGSGVFKKLIVLHVAKKFPALLWNSKLQSITARHWTVR
jgi:hypothetical protein